MWELLRQTLLTAGIIFFVMTIWIGVQEFYRQYSKKHPTSAEACKKEISDCILCSLKEICGKQDENRK